jgi:hypothetical protein
VSKWCSSSHSLASASVKWIVLLPLLATLVVPVIAATPLSGHCTIRFCAPEGCPAMFSCVRDELEIHERTEDSRAGAEQMHARAPSKLISTRVLRREDERLVTTNSSTIGNFRIPPCPSSDGQTWASSRRSQKS